jgi:hypothetical protein
MKPLNPKSEPTATGWSEVTLTVNDTLVNPSESGAEVVGLTQFTSLVVKIFADIQPFAFPGDAGNPISCYKTAQWN